VTVGPRGAAAGTVEFKSRATGERHDLSLEALFNRLSGPPAKVSPRSP
jgi:hypothetical protein